MPELPEVEHAAGSLRRFLAGAVVEARFLIYGRAGEPCARCRTLVEELELGGRTSAYCPGCQRVTGPSKPGRARSR